MSERANVSAEPADVRALRLSSPLAVFAIALAVRSALVIWAKDRIAPVEDGHFYHVVASRIAEGLGYTWLWPDGAVTYAAHYPVGYPALLGGAYALFGAAPVTAMAVNASFGSAAAVAVWWMVRRSSSPRAASFAGLAVALHPALVFYTPALMTEGVTAALLVLAGAAALRTRLLRGRRWPWLVGVGFLLGLTVLVRPQCLLVAPVYGFLCVPPDGAGGRLRRGASYAVAVTALACLTCLPWTMRNCNRMGRCVFVSANGGWNLLIGTALDGRGSWVPLEQVGVPSDCRSEFREAFKDTCFGAAAKRRIAAAPRPWLSLVPAKLTSTFDFSGAPGWYLHTANARAFPYEAKVALGSVETLWQRALLALALLALGRTPGPRATIRWRVALAAVSLLLTPLAWPSYVTVALLVALLGRAAFDEPLAVLAAAVILTTALVHAVFFGAGRYSLVCFPLVAALAASRWPPWKGESNAKSPGF